MIPASAQFENGARYDRSKILGTHTIPAKLENGGKFDSNKFITTSQELDAKKRTCN